MSGHDLLALTTLFQCGLIRCTSRAPRLLQVRRCMSRRSRHSSIGFVNILFVVLDLKRERG